MTHTPYEFRRNLQHNCLEGVRLGEVDKAGACPPGRLWDVARLP